MDSLILEAYNCDVNMLGFLSLYNLVTNVTIYVCKVKIRIFGVCSVNVCSYWFQ